MAVTDLCGGLVAFAFPGLPRARCAFTTRQAGNISLHTAKNSASDLGETVSARKKLLAMPGASSWAEVFQVHGNAMLIDPEPMDLEQGPEHEADGLATGRPGQILCIKTADCQPILLAHPAGYAAALHAGWRGNALRFPQSGVADFCAAYKLDPADVRAVRGPSLGHAEFVNFDAEWPPEFAPWYNRETRCMDLWRLTRDQLTLAGLKPGNIYGLDLCTYSLPGLFFSHRRGDGGRQAGLIWLE